MKTPTTARRLAVCLVVCTMVLLLLPLHPADCQNYVAYSIQINKDGSALWKITSFSDVNASVDTFGGFQEKVSNVISSASTVTHRSMSLNEGSLQINTNISSASKVTEYTFLWQNFSQVEGNRIFFGDVFAVNNFFGLLYGDDALQISYPSTYNVKSVTPEPYQRDNAAKTLDWARTQDLVNSDTNIVLTQAGTSDGSNLNVRQLYAIVAVAVAVVLGFLGIYLFKRRKTVKDSVSVEKQETVVSETEEGKIIKLLKSAGGTLRQSDIVDQSRFSKAKTSQLLTSLERNGIITRYKKGRDKIVKLTERVKSD
jgi:uncharacterized membrane protein